MMSNEIVTYSIDLKLKFLWNCDRNWIREFDLSGVIADCITTLESFLVEGVFCISTTNRLEQFHFVFPRYWSRLVHLIMEFYLLTSPTCLYYLYNLLKILILVNFSENIFRLLVISFVIDYNNLLQEYLLNFVIVGEKLNLICVMLVICCWWRLIVALLMN